MRWALALFVTAIALAVLPGSAAAAQRIVTIDAPGRNVDPARVSFNGADHPRRLRANVLLPDGYDGKRSFPVLYLLHGVGDAYDTWASASRGDVLNTAKGFPGIVVMPEAARGFYTNWWNGGRRGDPGWERYYLDELVPLVERRFRVRAGRRWHAIAGLSMGGMGSGFLATQLPGYFGSAATFSGFVSHQRAEVPLGLSIVGGVEYEDIFGPTDGFYATGHNPARLTDNLRHTRLYVTVGDGTPKPGVESSPSAIAGGGLIEAALRLQSEDFVAAARESGVSVLYRPLQGVHDWPYWRQHLRDAIAWGLFAPVPERPARWAYRTVASRGQMWDLGYRFARPPETVETFALNGRRLTAAGSGTVTIRTSAGCEFTASLPFERELPKSCTAARPAAIAGTVRPRRVRAGRRTRFRFRATTPAGPLSGATIRFAGRRVRTNRHGRASVTLRFRRPVRRRVGFKKTGLRSARATVVVRRAARRARPRFTG